MKTFLATTAAALVFAPGLAIAGPYEAPPAPPPVIIPDPVEPFEGFYAGLEFGHVMPEMDETRGPQSPFGDLNLDDGTAWGVFAGYNIQNGSMVYGGELRWLHFNDTAGLFGAEIESTIDLRGRVGFATGNFLVYGALGYSFAEGFGVDFDGPNYGIGAEYNVTDNFFLGADLTARDLEGDSGGFSYEAEANTATLRVGFRF